ncbi:uncharacterized protein BT62DRAFT_1078257 [Guyanagaster necrorhizus]|uniref:Uncharacterized protein n=1 Tax=Guyanagaster necrorhizus TaxID=856835 RepID=A0A9P7VNV7_9AGAR|nr:uncharacterized protein BT62DRAFT_1078257 [Guyanagaster necrorhizus MCA 3950]KAG7443775.1 hypothetical protein BT62DRAFT_1078257 [Guyanagaster necrorhizus MCA 3950]
MSHQLICTFDFPESARLVEDFDLYSTTLDNSFLCIRRGTLHLQSTYWEATQTDEFHSGSEPVTTPVDEDRQPSGFSGLHEQPIAHSDFDPDSSPEKPKSAKYLRFNGVELPTKTRPLKRVVAKAKRFARCFKLVQSSRVGVSMMLADSVVKGGKINLKGQHFSPTLDSTDIEEQMTHDNADLLDSDPFAAIVTPKETIAEQTRETTAEQTRETTAEQTRETTTEQARETTSEQARETTSEQATFNSVSAVENLDTEPNVNTPSEDSTSVCVDSSEHPSESDGALGEAPRSLDFVSEDVSPAFPKVLLFFPWCILFCATIFLSARHPEGMHCFAYWTDLAVLHVMVLFAFIVGYVAGEEANVSANNHSPNDLF